MTVARPVLAHVTTTDISLELLLGPQLEAFADHGFDVVGISAPGPFVDVLARRGVRHIGLRHSTRSFAPFADARVVVELASVFRSVRPTIVHTHNPKPGLFGRIAARTANVPIVVNTVHGLYAQRDDRRTKRVAVYAAERIASVCSHAELVQNVEDLATLRQVGVPERKLTLLGNGIDLRHFDPATITADERAAARAELGACHPDDVVVGSVGRLVREKGFLELFAAAARVRARTPAARFAVIGGDDPDKADALGPDDLAAARAAGVRLLGARDDVVRLYAAMDIFVLPSHREGFPRAAMEAAAMGVPIVATSIRGCRQVVDDGVTGILVPTRDVDALTDAIDRLVRDPDCRHRMGAAGRAKAREAFDQQRCIDITVDTYRRLLQARRAREDGKGVKKVLVTGVGGGVGQSIVKSLRPTDYAVVGMDSDALAAGLYAVPRARIGRAAGDPEFIDAIIDVCREEHCSLVFPGVEPELLPLSEGAPRLAAEGVTAIVSGPEIVRLCDDKLATAEFLAEHGFSAPTTMPFTEDVDQSWFPFVLKPRHGGARSLHTYVVHDKAEFDIARTLVDAQNCVVQEYIDGDEYTCGTVNLDGECQGVIAMRRSLRDGDTYKAVVVRDATIEARVAEVANALRPFGPCNFQLRLKGGEPWIFEINARCSGTTYARTLAGFNEPRMVADHVLAGTAPAYEIREITVLRYWNEVPVPSERIEGLRERGWLDGDGASL